MSAISGTQSSSLWKKMLAIFFAEFFGTAVLLFMGCTGGITKAYTPVIPQFPPMNFAFTVMFAMHTVGHISGAHLNPAVTIAAAIVGNIEFKLVPIYFLAEFAGAFAGYGILYALTPVSLMDPDIAFCNTMPHPELDILAAFALEFLFTCLLIFTVCTGMNKNIEDKQSQSESVRVGLVLAGIFMVLSPLTGASLNSARTLAPAVITNVWDGHWIYWAGPNAAAIVTAVIYRFIVMGKPKKETFY